MTSALKQNSLLQECPQCKSNGWPYLYDPKYIYFIDHQPLCWTHAMLSTPPYSTSGLKLTNEGLEPSET